MNDNPQKYNKTLLACYLGFITQAITANFTPLLFLMFNKSYEVSLGKIALIPAVFFLLSLLLISFVLRLLIKSATENA